MKLTLTLETRKIGRQIVQLFVPETTALKSAYAIEKAADQEAPFPYWAKIWPSAIAMAEYLEARPALCSGKLVIELAAGLGLPSLVVSPVAKKVTSSDYQLAAVDTIRKSIIHNRFENIEAILIDWKNLPENFAGDILLLSDINYDPVEFEQLEKIITNFLVGGGKVVLSTPQRLVAKSFIGAIAGHIYETWETVVENEPASVPISVYLLV